MDAAGSGSTELSPAARTGPAAGTGPPVTLLPDTGLPVPLSPDSRPPLPLVSPAVLTRLPLPTADDDPDAGA